MMWQAVVPWLEHWTVNQADQCSNSPAAVSKFGQFRSLQIACLSEETLKAIGPFYLVSMPGEVKDTTQGNRKQMLWTH